MREEVARARAHHERFVLCGFSLGSLVAAAIAAEHPAGLVGLVVLGNALTLSLPVRATLGFVDRRGWTLPDWYLLKLWKSDVRDAAQRARIAAYDHDPLRAALEVYRAGRDVLGRLDQITCPVLVVHGDRDRVCPASNAELFASRVASDDVTVRHYARSGHLVGADLDRDAVAADVTAFVARVGA